MVRMSPETSSDGRGLHVLSEVVGRTTDFVVRPDGVVMHALAVIYVLRAVEGIAQFKVIQHALHDVEVLVVPDSRWSAQNHAKVVSGLAARLGNDVRITLRLVDDIPVEASGKYRYVVSHVPPQRGLETEMRMVESARA
jgi:phenylacetate-CoA ligase